MNQSICLSLSLEELLILNISEINNIINKSYSNNNKKEFTLKLIKYYENLDLINEKNEKNKFIKSLEYAFDGHKNHLRESGKPFLNHAISTSYISAIFLYSIKKNNPQFVKTTHIINTVKNLVKNTIHDVIEERLKNESNFNYEKELNYIEKEFGKDVKELIYAVTPEPIKNKKIREKKLNEKINAYENKYRYESDKLLELDILKLSDTMANLIDIEGMKSKYNMNKKERQLTYLNDKLNQSLKIAERLDQLANNDEISLFVKSQLREVYIKIGEYENLNILS